MHADPRAWELQQQWLIYRATEAVPVPIMIVDADARICCWNGGCERLIGLKAEDVLHRSIDAVDLFDENAPWLCYLRWVLQQDGWAIRHRFEHARPVDIIPGAWEVVTQLTCGDSVRDVEMYSAPIRNDSGERIGALLMIRDLHERKKLLDQLLHAQKMETLGTLVAGVAHEINNPLNLLLYNIPLFQRLWQDVLPVITDQARVHSQTQYAGLPIPFLRENLPSLLSDMKLAVERIAKIVTGLKSYSRFSDPAEKEPFDLNVAVENAMRLSQATLRGKHIVSQIELADHLPPLFGSIHSIEQVVLNLIINAVQAIDHEQGKIQVRTDLRPDGYIVLTISDNGKGIDPSMASKIFDPFVTDKQDKGGTGLGLSVSYNIVQAHGGTIQFKSRVSAGTTFQVLFPVGEKRPVRRILIVDDDPLIRDLLSDVLVTHRSCEVEEAANGVEACIRLGTFHPDLLVLDLFMPEMNGLEVCRIIRNDPEFHHLRILVVTGHSSHLSLDEIRKMNKIDILFKPFDIQDFLKKVDNILSE